MGVRRVQGGGGGHRDPFCPPGPCGGLQLQHWQISRGPTGWIPSFRDPLPPPPSLCLLGLLGSLLAELNEGLSLFVPLPGFQQLEDLISCRRGGEGWWEMLAVACSPRRGAGGGLGGAQPQLQYHVPVGLGWVRGRRVWGTRPMSTWSLSASRPGRRQRGKKASPSRSLEPSVS